MWRELESVTEEFILGNLRDGCVFADIGSNLGYYSLAVAQQFPNARVLAFEPNPVVATLLERNVVENGFSARVSVHRLAVSDAEGTLNFLIDPENSGHCRIGDHAEGESFPVQSVIFDHWIKRQDPSIVPDVIKMDIEGAETKAIRGMRAFLEEHKPHLILEAFDDQLKEFGSSQTELIQLTEELGYRQVVPIAEGNLFLKHRQRE